VYLGSLILQISDYKKPLLIGYSGNTLGQLRFEIFGSRDFDLLSLTTSESPFTPGKFEAHNFVNMDSNFIGSLTPDFSSALLDELLKCDQISDMVTDIISNDSTILRTSVTLNSSVCVSLFPNGRDETDENSFPYEINSGGKIAKEIANVSISKLKSKNEADFLRQLIR